MKRRSSTEVFALHQSALAFRLEGLTFSEIGSRLGITRQRAQQVISPSKALTLKIRTRAGDACEGCGADGRGHAGHIHHRAARGMTVETYNVEPNLTLLCIPCHRTAHADPIVQERKRPRTSEEKRVNSIRLGFQVGAQKIGITPEEYEAHRLQGERWCSFHRAWEPETTFVRNAGSSSGFSSICRLGNREKTRHYQDADYWRSYVEQNREKVNAYQREYHRKKRERHSLQAAS